MIAKYSALNPGDLKFLFHLSVSTIYTATTIYSADCFNNVPKEFLKNDILRLGHDFYPYFLCFWTGMIHNFYFGIYLLLDVIKLVYSENNLPKKFMDTMHSIGSFLLFSIVFPYAVVVSILFWTFFILHQEKMYPSVLDEVIPFWTNHFMHTYPLPLAIMYMAISNSKVPSKLSTFLGVTMFTVLYCYYFVEFRVTQGKWLYLVFEVTTPYQTIFIFTFGILGPIIFQFLAFEVNKVLTEVKETFRNLHQKAD